jgi:hypothetical protein
VVVVVGELLEPGRARNCNLGRLLSPGRRTQGTQLESRRPTVWLARTAETLLRERRAVNPLMVPARYNFLYSSSRPPCGRPPAALGRRRRQVGPAVTVGPSMTAIECSSPHVTISGE